METVLGEEKRIIPRLVAYEMLQKELAQQDTPGGPARKSGNMFRVGIFLGFGRLTTRAEGPHGAHVRRAERN